MGAKADEQPCRVPRLVRWPRHCASRRNPCRDARLAPRATAAPRPAQGFPESPSVTILPAELLSDGSILQIGEEQVDPLELVATSRTVSPQGLELKVDARDRRCRFRLSVDGSVYPIGGTARLVDRATGEVSELAEFLEHNPPTLLFGDGSVVKGPQICASAARNGAAPARGACRARLDPSEPGRRVPRTRRSS